MYNGAWYDQIQPLIVNPEANVIAWDFISHHPRGGVTEQKITVELKRKFIDLGSFIVRAKVYRTSNAIFLPSAMFTGNIMARDFFLIDAIRKVVPEDSIHLIHSILMFHQ